MVLEYLLFRGFTRSFRAVVADCQGDRLRAFEVRARQTARGAADEGAAWQ